MFGIVNKKNIITTWSGFKKYFYNKVGISHLFPITTLVQMGFFTDYSNQMNLITKLIFLIIKQYFVSPDHSHLICLDSCT